MADPKLDPGVTTYSYPGGQSPDFLGRSISDEGEPVSAGAQDINFVGTGVVAKDIGGDNVQIEVPGDATITGFVEAPFVKEYTMVGRASYPFTVRTGYFKTSTGTATVSVKVNSVGVAGLISILAGVTPQTIQATPTDVAVGDRVTLDVTGISLPADLEVCIGIDKIVE